MEKIKQNIQDTRAELKKIIVEQVKPMRAKLDNLLKEEAKRICPFEEDEIITLDNGKKGIIKEIDYRSLNYDFGNDNEFSLSEKMDDVDYVYAYIFDEKEFSITWKLSGLRMIINGTEIGKVPFSGISPDRFNIDVTSKTISQKPLKDLLDNMDWFSDFSTI